MKTLLTLIIVPLLLTIATNCYSQGPAILNKIRLEGNLGEFPTDLQLSGNGSFVILINSGSHDGDFIGCNNNDDDDIWVFKFKLNGTLLWKHCYGGSSQDVAYSIRNTPDGGYIFTGKTYSNDGDVIGHQGSTADLWVVKLDQSGNIQWQDCLGGSKEDIGTSIAVTNDGGYIVTGYTQSIDGDVSGHHGNTANNDVWVVKLNSSGQIQWQKCFGGSKKDLGYTIIQANDHDYVVAGVTESSDGDVIGNHGGFGDIWVIRFDEAGNLLWQRSNGGNSTDEMNEGNHIVETSDGSLIIGGKTSSKDGDVSGFHFNPDFGTWDAWLFKLDAGGNFLKQNCLGGIGYEECNSLSYSQQNELIMIGSATSDDGTVKGSNGSEDFWIVKLNPDLKVKGQQCIGGNESDRAYGAALQPNGKLLVAGVSNSANGDFLTPVNPVNTDPWIIQLSSSPVATVYTDSADKEIYCLGDPINVYYTAKGNFGAGNKFYALLFTNDQPNFDTIGVIASTVSGVITGEIPEHISSANEIYHYIKVVATKPSVEGNIYYQFLDVGCQPPSKPVVTMLTESSAVLEWTDLNCAQEYNVRYKIFGEPSTTFIYQNTLGTSILLDGLSPSTMYTFSVASICDTFQSLQSEYSPQKIFTTLPLRISTETTAYFDIYPNPATDFLILKMHFPASQEESVMITVKDVFGRTVSEEKILNTQQTQQYTLQIDQSLANGCYFIIVKTYDQSLQKQFMLQRQ